LGFALIIAGSPLANYFGLVDFSTFRLTYFIRSFLLLVLWGIMFLDADSAARRHQPIAALWHVVRAVQTSIPYPREAVLGNRRSSYVPAIVF